MKSKTSNETARGSNGKAGTRDRIITAAEKLFAEHGVAGVSVRQITAAAKVNIAALNYHFGNKDAVLAAIFERRAGSITRRRLELLARCVVGTPDEERLERVIEAYLLPMFEFAKVPGGALFLRLRSRLALERSPEILKLNAHFDPTTRIYIDTIAQILPHLKPEEVYWRFLFFLGAYLHTLANSGHIQILSDGRCDPGDYEEVMRQIVPFIAAGFRAPSVPEPRRQEMPAKAERRGAARRP